MRTSAPSALAFSRLLREPGTRMASPKVVKMTSGRSAMRYAVIDPAHRQDADRAAGAMHFSSIVRRQHAGMP